jgi:predicted permease
MNLLAYLRSLSGKFLNRSQVADDMDEELCSHIQLRADDLERSGLKRLEAERRARIEFGARERFKEESYEAMGGRFIETLVQDMRIAIRVLRKSPGFTLAAVLTLALAIGANSVVFGILDALILRPLNVAHAEKLWGIENGDGSGWQSYPNYLDLRDRNRSFEDLVAIKMTFVGLDTGKDPAPATGWATTGNYFDVLGVKPFLGRVFHASDEHGPNSAPYVVLSYSYWHARFHDDRGVVGRTVLLNKHPFAIIGVAQPDFGGTLLFIPAAFFMPIVNQEQVDGESIFSTRSLNNREVFDMLGRLKPGVTQAQAIGDLNSIHAYLEKTYPKDVDHNTFTLGHPGLYVFARPAGAFVAGLMLLAGMILLAACANLGGLFAARAADRSREVALRLSLGSSRVRILRQLLTEAVVISLIGGAAGLLGSIVLLRRLSTWEPFSQAPIHIPVTPHASIYLVALGLALASGFLFGIVPVREVLRANPYEIVKAGLAGTVKIPGRFKLRLSVRDVLLVIQIAICAVLVTSSMVAIRGMLRSLQSNLGFEPRNAMTAGMNLSMAGYTGDTIPAFQRRIFDAMQTIPGVERVGLVNNYPPLVNTAANSVNAFRDETRDFSQSHVAAVPFRFEISPGYFDAAATGFVAGRDLTWRDDKSAPPVAVINREFANIMFGSVTAAVGRHFRLGDGTHVQVVGVVQDGKYLALTESQRPAMFLPFLQSPSSIYSTIVVRSHRDPEELATAMRRKVRELDAGLPIETETWRGLLDVVLFPARVATMALGVLGLMGAMLSITGIFGMAAYSVSKRLRELGIRMALGAKRSEVLEAALGRAVKLLAFGSVAGLLLGILATRVLASIVYQATPRDPLVLAGVVLAMALLGLVATWIPAQRALSVDPMILLREE